MELLELDLFRIKTLGFQIDVLNILFSIEVLWVSLRVGGRKPKIVDISSETKDCKKRVFGMKALSLKVPKTMFSWKKSNYFQCFRCLLFSVEVSSNPRTHHMWRDRGAPTSNFCRKTCGMNVLDLERSFELLFVVFQIGNQKLSKF